VVAEKLLITGADGYVGRRILRAALERSVDSIVLWVRAKDTTELDEKRKSLASELRAGNGRVELAWGDLESDQPFARIDARGVTAIVHSAAVIRFNVEADLAERVNVRGTEKLLCLAETCRDLRALDLLSTVYASGLATGRVQEQVGDGRAGFANHYESSKAAAERLLQARFAHLPWRILRIATVIADDDSGVVTQQTAVHNTLRLFFYGLLSVLPGERDVVPYFVTGAFVAEAWSAVRERGPLRRVYHVAHSKAEGLRLGPAIDGAFDVFERDASFRARRVLRPEFCDLTAFELLVASTSAFRSSVLGQALASVAPFARQLFVDKDIVNDNLRACMSSYRAPDQVGAGDACHDDPMIDPNLHWLLSYYRSSEIAGSLFFGKLVRTLRPGRVQIDMTKHFADEAQHAWLWTSCIHELGAQPLKLTDAYQDRYVGVAGVPANLMEVLSVTQVFERRVIGEYSRQLRVPNLEPAVAHTLERIMQDEKWHLEWVRDALKTMEAEYGAEAVRAAEQRFSAADVEVYRETSREHEQRLAALFPDRRFPQEAP
jgi:nucleoside-diphosphate-sugar epimerase